MAERVGDAPHGGVVVELALQLVDRYSGRLEAGADLGRARGEVVLKLAGGLEDAEGVRKLGRVDEGGSTDGHGVRRAGGGRGTGARRGSRRRGG